MVILLIARGLTRLVDQFFTGVAVGRVRVTWLRAETADATRRIVIALVWVFALHLTIRAHHHLPGMTRLSTRRKVS